MPSPAICKRRVLTLGSALLLGFSVLHAQQENPAPAIQPPATKPAAPAPAATKRAQDTPTTAQPAPTVPAPATKPAPTVPTPATKPAQDPPTTAQPAPATQPPATTPPIPTPSPAANPGPETKPATATPIDIKKSELGQPIWNPDWDEIIEKALPPSLLSNQVPQDVRRFCPRFYRMSDTDKRAFWAYFFQALAGAEAGLNPTSHVKHIGALESRDSVTRLPIHCEGLLQLTYEDSVRYGCDFDWEVDRNLKPGDPARTILQPKNNLECGVKILTRQIIDNHEPIFYRLSYWATLRPGTVSYRVFARQMVSPPHACGYPSRARRILDRVLSVPGLVADR